MVSGKNPPRMNVQWSTIASRTLSERQRNRDYDGEYARECTEDDPRELDAGPVGSESRRR